MGDSLLWKAGLWAAFGEGFGMGGWPWRSPSSALFSSRSKLSSANWPSGSIVYFSASMQLIDTCKRTKGYSFGDSNSRSRAFFLLIYRIPILLTFEPQKKWTKTYRTRRGIDEWMPYNKIYLGELKVGSHWNFLLMAFCWCSFLGHKNIDYTDGFYAPKQVFWTLLPQYPVRKWKD